MSLDIDWSLLSTPGASTSSHPFPSPSSPTTPSSSSSTPDLLTSTLISRLNTLLSSTPLPSFIGPITVTSFSFGQVGPQVEIRDIRDVWRAFEEGDAEGDDAQAEEGRRAWKEEEQRRRLMSPLDEEEYDLVSPLHPHALPHSNTHSGLGGGYGHHRDYDRDYDYDYDYDDGLEPPEETASVYSMTSPRAPSIAAVGLGTQALGSRSRSRAPSLFSQPIGQTPGRPYAPKRYLSSGSMATHRSHLPPLPHGQGHGHGDGYAQGQNPTHGYPSLRPSSTRASHPAPYPHPYQYPPYLSSPPGSPTPSLPPDPRNSGSSALPSLQLHLRVTHASDLALTLLTSLQVNYPSALFMSLPLKLSITGLALNADVVLAYNGEKQRVHLCVVDEQADEGEGEGLHPYAHAKPIGERLLPNLNIESEIGHADAHVLRNVGKVEKFIADVVRKLLVDELVFPNFHTLAL